MSDVPADDYGPLISQWRQSYTGFRRFEYLFYMEMWGAAVKAHPDWDHNQLNNFMLGIQKNFQTEVLQGASPAYEATKTVEEGLVKLTGLLPDVEGIDPQHYAEAVDWALQTFVWPYWDTANQVTSINTKLAVADRYMGTEFMVIPQALASMSANPDQQKEQIQSFNGFFLDFHITNPDGTFDTSPAAVIQNNPGLIPPEIQASVQPRPDGTVLIDDAAISVAATRFFGDFNASMDSAINQSLTTLHDLNGQLDAESAVAMLTQPAAELAQAKQAADGNAAAYATAASNAGGAWIDIVGTLVGYGDPKLGRQITAVGNAALKIGDTISKFSQTVAALGAVGQVGEALASAALTGNIIQAALSLVSAFADQGPTPEQMILDEVGKLRDQVDQLHQEMTQRFDHIDQELSAIYATVAAQLDKIDTKLGQLTDTVANIQQTLYVTLAAVHRIEADMSRYLQDNARIELLEAINGALEFRKRTGQDMTFDQYTAWENVLYTWAVTVSKDSTEADTGLPTTDSDADANLADRSLDSNINYVNSLLTSRGLPAFGDGNVLPNPRTYAQAARSLAKMQWENAQYAARIDSARTQSVRAVGEQLRASLASFATSGTAMVNGLLALYLNAAQQLHDRVEADRQQYLTQVVPHTDLGWPASVNITADFWAVDPATTDLGYAPPPVESDVYSPHLPPPSNLRQLVPVAVLNNEWLAGANTVPNQPRQSPLQFVISWAWTDEKTQVIPTPHGPVEVTTGVVAVTLAVRYPDSAGQPVTLWKRTITGPRLDEKINWDPVVKYWLDPQDGNFKAQFESMAASDPLSAAEQSQRDDLLNSLTTTMTQEFISKRLTFSGATVGNLANSPYSAWLMTLSAISRLTQAVLQLGLPRATLFDDAMRTMALGDGHLPRGDEVVSWQQAANGSTQLPMNDLIVLAQQLKEILTTRLAFFQAAQSNGQYVDDEPITAGTLDFIDSAVKVAAYVCPER